MIWRESIFENWLPLIDNCGLKKDRSEPFIFLPPFFCPVGQRSGLKSRPRLGGNQSFRCNRCRSDFKQQFHGGEVCHQLIDNRFVVVNHRLQRVPAAWLRLIVMGRIGEP